MEDVGGRTACGALRRSPTARWKDVCAQHTARPARLAEGEGIRRQLRRRVRAQECGRSVRGTGCNGREPRELTRDLDPLRTDVDLIAMMVRLRAAFAPTDPKSHTTARTEKKARSLDSGLIDQIPPGLLRLRSGPKCAFCLQIVSGCTTMVNQSVSRIRGRGGNGF